MRYKRQIAVVYNAQDALKKVNEMREKGFLEHEIHLFARDIHEFHSLKIYTEIDVHQSGNFIDKMMSVMTGCKHHEYALKKFKFSDEELHHYGRLIQKGAIVIIAQHDFPVEKQPTTYKLKKLPKKLPAKSVPNPLQVSKEPNNK